MRLKNCIAFQAFLLIVQSALCSRRHRRYSDSSYNRRSRSASLIDSDNYSQRRGYENTIDESQSEDDDSSYEDIDIEELKNVQNGDDMFECLAYAQKESAFKQPNTRKLTGKQNKVSNFVSKGLQLEESNEYDSGDLQQTSDIQTMLFQYQTMPQNVAQKIDECEMNLDPALRRCEQVNGSGTCEAVYRSDTKKLAYYAKKCPNGYSRYGCCKCVKRCDFATLKPEENNKTNLFCDKASQYTIPLDIGFENLEACVTKFEACELYGENGFYPKCKEGFKKLNQNLCFPKCPLGWPDLGDKCLKAGTLGLGAPFTWTAGD